MCCIAACYRDRLTDDLIDSMLVWNQDGFGMAWIEKGKVRWQKGLDTITAKLFARHLPLPYVAHARLATVGSEKFALAHPFPIERGSSTKLKGSARRVLFHNGHVSNWRALVRASDGKQTTSMGDKWSDSRAIAHVIATRGLKILDDLHGNRFAVLSPKGIVRYGDGWGQANELPTIHLSSDVERRVVVYSRNAYGQFDRKYEPVVSTPAGVVPVESNWSDRWD